MSDSGDHEQREVYYQGMVQGVGFRYTTRRIATRFTVTGYVENLADGQVLVVVEGPSGEVGRFLGAVGDALGHFIHNTRESTRPATGEFRQFGIRH